MFDFCLNILCIKGKRHSSHFCTEAVHRVFFSLFFVFLSATIGLADNSVNADIPIAETNTNKWSVSFDTEVRYNFWLGSRGYPASSTVTNGGSGSQVYVPISVQVSGRLAEDFKFEFLGKSGYVSSKQMTASQVGSSNTTTDTSLTPTITYLGWESVQPFTSLTLNLPTGTRALFGDNRFARMDGDLVDLGTFGEGFNFGPSVCLNIPFTSDLILTLTLGYTSRGVFNKEGPVSDNPQGTVKTKPGNVASVSADLGYQLDKLSLQGSVSYSRETITYSADVPQYRAGPSYSVSGSVSYKWSDDWLSSLSVSRSYSIKNDTFDTATGDMNQESNNSNSAVYRAAADLTYKYNSLSIGPTSSYLYRDRNGYDSATLTFVPAKTKISAGAVASYVIDDKTSIKGRVERAWIKEFENAGSDIPTITSGAWLVSSGVTFNF